MSELLCSYVNNTTEPAESGYFLVDSSASYPQFISFVKKNLKVTDPFVVCLENGRAITNQKSLQSLLENGDFTIHIKKVSVVRAPKSAACARFTPHVVSVAGEQGKPEIRKPAPVCAPVVEPVPQEDSKPIVSEPKEKENGIKQKPSVVNHRAICDNCGDNSEIVGIRYKCLQCPDYDLCATCEESNLQEPFHQASHIFAKIVHPTNYFTLEKRNAALKVRQIQILKKQIKEAGAQNKYMSRNRSSKGNRIASLEEAVATLQQRMDELST